MLFRNFFLCCSIMKVRTSFMSIMGDSLKSSSVRIIVILSVLLKAYCDACSSTIVFLFFKPVVCEHSFSATWMTTSHQKQIPLYCTYVILPLTNYSHCCSRSFGSLYCKYFISLFLNPSYGRSCPRVSFIILSLHFFTFLWQCRLFP